MIEVRRGKRISPWWLAILLGAALLPVITSILAPAAARPLFDLLKAAMPEAVVKTYFSSIITVLAFAFAVLLLFLWVRLFEGRPFHTIGFHARRALVGIPLGFGLALLFTTLMMGGLSALGMIRPQAPSAEAATLPVILQGILVAALMYAVQGSTEEMIYRGWMQNVLALRIGPPIATAIATVAFTWAHADNPGFGLLPGINLVLFAVFLSLLALRTGSLWASCAWHAAWNWLLSNIWGVPLSGIDPEGGTAMTWTLTGPALMTGGTWGPEGGLLATAILAGAVVWASFWRGFGEPAKPVAPPMPSPHGQYAPYRATPRR